VTREKRERSRKVILKKILIIRFSSIGDIVLTSPVVRCLKKQIRGVEVHFLTKKQFLPVIEANPHIDKIWLYDHNFKELIPQLKSQGFDLLVDLHKNYRSFFVTKQLARPSATFSKLNFRKWMMVNLKINFLPPVHIVDRYMEAVGKFGVKNDGKGLDYYIPEHEEVDLGTLPETHRNGYVAIATGGKHHTKILPEEKLTEVCKNLTLPVILLGGKEDRERGEKIVSALGPAVFNACGQYSIPQSASLIRQATAVLSNDTGLMHIAAAYRKKMVSVWGNTIPAFGMFPYLPAENQEDSLIAEVKGLSCRPCSKLGYRSCPKKHFKCMMDIDTQKIIRFLNTDNTGKS